jgi:hypothetical protein
MAARGSQRVASTPIANPRTWLHTVTGWIWDERAHHRGRVILSLRGAMGSHTIRMRPEELAENPWWISVARDHPSTYPAHVAAVCARRAA